MARELGLIIDKLDPKIIDLEESKELEQTKADVLDEQYDPQKDS
jgi:hypothetical protein